MMKKPPNKKSRIVSDDGVSFDTIYRKKLDESRSAVADILKQTTQNKTNVISLHESGTSSEQAKISLIEARK